MIFHYLIRACVYISVGCFLQLLHVYVQSEYLYLFLHKNLIMILLAFFAINSAAIIAICNSIQKISNINNSVKFTKTIDQIFLSIREQVFFIALSIILLVLSESFIISGKFLFLIKSLLIASFVYAINIVYDVAQSILILTRAILDIEN